MDNHEILNSSEDYLEYQTSYVASLTICEPYKKNISGTSYSRVCNVYDYDTDNPGYKYPHNYKNDYVKQQYLPDDVKNHKYYKPGDNKFEQATKEYWDKIKK